MREVVYRNVSHKSTRQFKYGRAVAVKRTNIVERPNQKPHAVQNVNRVPRFCVSDFGASEQQYYCSITYAATLLEVPPLLMMMKLLLLILRTNRTRDGGDVCGVGGVVSGGSSIQRPERFVCETLRFFVISDSGRRLFHLCPEVPAAGFCLFDTAGCFQPRVTSFLSEGAKVGTPAECVSYPL